MSYILQIETGSIKSLLFSNKGNRQVLSWKVEDNIIICILQMRKMRQRG